MKPKREPARNNQQTYFVSFQTAQRTPLFRHERWLLLLLNVMERHKTEFLLHDYAVMPDHVHLLITPAAALERCPQLIKGGFSFQAKRQLEWNGPVWQEGFSDHRIRDAHDFEEHLRYIAGNIAALPEVLRIQPGRHGRTSSFELAPSPQRLKPLLHIDIGGGTEVPPLQNKNAGPIGEQNGL